MTRTSPAARTEPLEPVARPAAAPITIAVASCLIALGFIAGHDFLVERDVIPGPEWTRNAFHWLSRVTWHGWMLPVAIGAIVIGAAMLFAVAKPRVRTHVPVAGEPVLWLRPTDVARRSTAVTMHVDGVLRAHTTVARRTAKVTVTTDAAASHASDAVRHAVEAALMDLVDPPRVEVVVDREQAE